MNSYVCEFTWLGEDLILRESWSINGPEMQINGLVREAGRNVRPVLKKK